LASVELRGLTKRFGSLAVVDDVSLRIDHGQLICLLGPSGCGKTTTLRLIAGFLEPTDGEILVADRLVSSQARTLPPEQRKMSMIFQSYALWPHMTVAENITYGLRLRKFDRDAIAKKLKTILATTRLEVLAQRYPGELSGGQQQRVALARAIAGKPKLFLLDEPLSNLDAKLREEMRGQILELQRKLGVTTLYVTHDQVEALSMSHRIAVMEQGRIVEIAAPRDVYLHPRSRFAAQFVGLTNIVPARVTGDSEGTCAVDAPFARILCQNGGAHHAEGERAMVLIRPENISVSTAPPAEMTNVWRGRVVSTVFLGEFLECVVACGDTQMRARVNPFASIETGDDVFLQAPPERLSIIAE
jgi:iron(III) transport system ATP-binding protein